MSTADTKLDNRDMYLLGMLSERTAELGVKEGKFPRGCDEAQALALAQAGYLVSTPYYFADGSAELRYEITSKGHAAWNAYRFI
jgi:hypothetical protein